MKTFNNNNHKGGQLEVVMLRAFGRDFQLRSMVYCPHSQLHSVTNKLLQIRQVRLNKSNDLKLDRAIFNHFLTEKTEARGTIEDVVNCTYTASGELPSLSICSFVPVSIAKFNQC